MFTNNPCATAEHNYPKEKHIHMFTNNPSLTHVDNTEMLARNYKHNTHSTSETSPRFKAIRPVRPARCPLTMNARQRGVRLQCEAVRGNASGRLAKGRVEHLELNDAIVSFAVAEPIHHLTLWHGKRHIANEDTARIQLAPMIILGRLAPRRQLNFARRPKGAHGDDWRRRA